ncbi:MAG: uroporphyrinogen-III synthase [Epsilonproteobacteria bacterium]|nr:uroporphyrinogen-III synthase [Campylobacterota bacterium]
MESIAPIFILSEKQYEDAGNLPVILIRHLSPPIDLTPYDALIFSSKNGVLALEKLMDDWKAIPSFSIGSGTSATIRELGGNIVYEARNSYGDKFADEIKGELEGKRALFLRAKVVTSALNEKLIKAGVLLDEVIVYETVCSECDSVERPPKGSSIIFSSPSTIECFFRCFMWDQSYQAIVIGEKTASFMPSNVPYKSAEKQSIPSCIELAKKLSKKGL